MNNSTTNASPSPIASRTRGTSISNARIKQMVKQRTCSICPYKANSLVALKHHLVRHSSSSERSRALRATMKLLSSPATPVARVSSGNESSPLQEKFRELFPNEFGSSSSSSPENSSSVPQSVVGTPPTTSVRRSPNSGITPRTLDALASQLNSIFSPGRTKSPSSKLEKLPTECSRGPADSQVSPQRKDEAPHNEQSILEMLLGSQIDTLPEMSPPLAIAPLLALLRLWILSRSGSLCPK
ncbi:hypothetical protein TNCV_4952291 [Trichonephila clavipes]|nr:hypothetical protein TNCV_4952291 [Trichonephila clavipes]